MEYHNTYTYIIESQGYYKIGKTKNIIKRLASFDTQNPLFELVRLYNKDFEGILHSIYMDKRFKLEWFGLSNQDLEAIDLLASNSNIKKLSTKLSNRRLGVFSKRAKNNRARKIRQVDLEDNIINSWSSIKDAAKDTGFNLSSLHNASRLGKLHRGYRWLYDDGFGPNKT